MKSITLDLRCEQAIETICLSVPGWHDLECTDEDYEACKSIGFCCLRLEEMKRLESRIQRPNSKNYGDEERECNRRELAQCKEEAVENLKACRPIRVTISER